MIINWRCRDLGTRLLIPPFLHTANDHKLHGGVYRRPGNEARVASQ